MSLEWLFTLLWWQQPRMMWHAAHNAAIKQTFTHTRRIDQVCFFSATLHSPEITDLAGKICINPTWVDLKGVDSVPETVHHVIYRVDPVKDAQLLTSSRTKPITDGVHIQSSGGGEGMEAASETIKQLKQQALLRVIDKFEMSQCMIFCRTNFDCDNLEVGRLLYFAAYSCASICIDLDTVNNIIMLSLYSHLLMILVTEVDIFMQSWRGKEVHWEDGDWWVQGLNWATEWVTLASEMNKWNRRYDWIFLKLKGVKFEYENALIFHELSLHIFIYYIDRTVPSCRVPCIDT